MQDILETKEPEPKQEQQNLVGRHQEIGHKSLLQSDALYQVSIACLFTFLFTPLIKLGNIKKKLKKTHQTI